MAKLSSLTPNNAKAESMKSFHFGNELLLPDQPHHDAFLQLMAGLLKSARYFGVAGYGGLLWQLWAVVVLASLLTIEFGALVKVVRALAGWARDTANQRSVAARFAGAMFYAAALSAQLLCWRLSRRWRALANCWVSAERSLNVKCVPPEPALKKRLVVVSACMATGATVEHLLSILATTGFDCTLSDFIKTYILKSHGFLLLDKEYFGAMALPLVLASNVATVLWNLQDVLIVLVSMGLTARYRRLNRRVAALCLDLRRGQHLSRAEHTVQVHVWRKVREAFVRQANLVRKANDALGLILLSSSFFSFYFICLRLFLGITQGFEGGIFLKMYSAVALCWICARMCCVLLAAADVHEHSRSALPHLYACRTRFYNVEIERLQNQLSKEHISLSGMGFFRLTRAALLQVASSVLTYVLMLLQFDNQADDLPDEAASSNSTSTR